MLGGSSKLFYKFERRLSMGLKQAQGHVTRLRQPGETLQGGMKDTFKSTSDGAQFLGEKLVGWSSKKQDCTALSNSGSRIACPIRLLGAPKSFWMRNSYRIMLSLQQDSIYCDSKSAIAISTNPGPTLKNKHTFVSLPFH
ncbi:hypothetical protein Tco_0087282 [Tanacetum coccineum]